MLVVLLAGLASGQVCHQRGDGASCGFTVPRVLTQPSLPVANLTHSGSLAPASFHAAVLVLSGPGNRAARRRVRRLRLPGFHLRLLFLVGRSGNSSMELELEQESQRHDDLLRLDMLESYNQLPRKTLAGLTFVLDRLPHVDLVIKIDDDLEISEEDLEKALVSYFPWDPDRLYCYPLKGIKPHRLAQGLNAKMYVPHTTFPDPIFPDYCLGWLVATTPTAARQLLEQVSASPPVHIDDVYVTGILRQGTNVSLSMLSTNPFFHSKLYTHIISHCRLMNWALHLLAYDLAYEPTGWPWNTVKMMKGGVGELSKTIDNSSSDINMELLFTFSCHLLLLITVLFILNSLRTKIFHQSSDKAQTDIGTIATAIAIAIVLIISTFIAMVIIMATSILTKYVASVYIYWRVLLRYIFV